MIARPHVISIRAVLVLAHAIAYRNTKFLYRVGWPWFLALVAILAAVNWLQHAYFFTDNELYRRSDLMFLIIEEIITLSLGVPIAVAWHRFVLLNEDVRHPFAIALWREYLLYFAVGLLICFSFCVPMVAIIELTDNVTSMQQSTMPAEPDQPGTSNSPQDEVATCVLCIAVLVLGSLATMLPLSYLPARFSLALPASAVGVHASPLRLSWNATRGNFLKLFCGMLLTLWPLIVWAAILISISPETPSSQTFFVLEGTIGSLIYFITGILWVAFLSIAFNQLQNMHTIK